MKVYQDNFLQGLVVDSFAGGGGASTGIEFALGRPVDIAINHDPAAIEMHRENHPYTRHYCESVWDIDPVQVCAGRSVDILWASPDCKHFSKAKGGKPVDKKIRGLAWVVLRWAAKVRPRIIFLENVEEFQTWCPVRHGKPVPSKKGETFRKFVGQLEDLGYVVDWRELRACDYGAPTSRKRLYLVARCDGERIVFPEPTHGYGLGKKPFKTAAECIDWSVPCPSIFDRKKPLCEATMRRIAKGMVKYVLGTKKPFIMQCYGGGYSGSGADIERPLPTITARDHNVIVTPYFATYHAEQKGNDCRCQKITDPLTTIDTSNRYAIVTPFLTKYYSGDHGQKANVPLGTITTKERFSCIVPFMTHFYSGSGSAEASSVREPIRTITANNKIAVATVKLSGQNVGRWDEIRSMLNRYTDYHIKDDEMLVFEIGGERFFIADIGMRFLMVRELYAAQGFPSDYKFEFDVNGKPYSKKDAIARCGNSVSPIMAQVLVRANVKELTYKTTINSMKQLEELIA